MDNLTPQLFSHGLGHVLWWWITGKNRFSWIPARLLLPPKTRPFLCLASAVLLCPSLRTSVSFPVLSLHTFCSQLDGKSRFFLFLLLFCLMHILSTMILYHIPIRKMHLLHVCYPYYVNLLPPSLPFFCVPSHNSYTIYSLFLTLPFLLLCIQPQKHCIISSQFLPFSIVTRWEVDHLDPLGSYSTISLKSYVTMILYKYNPSIIPVHLVSFPTPSFQFPSLRV